MPLIQTENLTKVYGKGEAAVVALDHVTMTVEPREIVAVMGPSGCGKSTLLHMLGGLDRPTEGQVTIDGSALASLSDDDLTQIRRRKIGFVFQFFNLIPILSSVENAALPLILTAKTVPRPARNRVAAEGGAGIPPGRSSGPVVRGAAAAGRHRPGAGHRPCAGAGR